MRDTSLIFVEGIMGAGKSTTAWFLTEELQRRGVAARFVLRRRIEHARRLLTETDMPLALIALESGFANQSYLTHVFKAQCGITPRAYRQGR
jgi:AraC-like DNA-binding protein